MITASNCGAYLRFASTLVGTQSALMARIGTLISRIAGAGSYVKTALKIAMAVAGGRESMSASMRSFTAGGVVGAKKNWLIMVAFVPLKSASSALSPASS